jgi:hypothetical protein
MLLEYNMRKVHIRIREHMGEYTAGEFIAREWAQPCEHVAPTNHGWMELFERYAETAQGRTKQLGPPGADWRLIHGRVGSAGRHQFAGGQGMLRGARTRNCVDRRQPVGAAQSAEPRSRGRACR